ncbi:hypothetical protein STAQ_07720 [Allostella sp. ATCC 35155]|nr:hypothetical protein STAQ_07720 [Stella sp. ATCC 35155]
MKPQRPRPARDPAQNRPPQRAEPPHGGPRRRPPSGEGGSGQGWLWGHHPVAAALANPARTCRRLLVTPESAPALAAALAAVPEARRPRTEPADRPAIDRLLPPGAVHQGVALAVEPLPVPDLDDLLDGLPAGAPATLVLLDQVTDPHNIGAVLRSAAAFGAAAVVLPDRHAPPVTGTLAKSASGAVEVVPLVRVINLARTIVQLQEAGFLCLGLAEEGQTALSAERPAERVAIALGAEGDGLRRLTRERCDRLVRLPTRPPIASLNVSNAAAVALFALLPRE